MSLLILLPLASLILFSMHLSAQEFWRIISDRRVLAAFQVSFGSTFLAATVDLFFGLEEILFHVPAVMLQNLQTALKEPALGGGQEMGAAEAFPVILPALPEGLAAGQKTVPAQNRSRQGLHGFLLQTFAVGEDVFQTEAERSHGDSLS
jgi:hypothetical protein